MKLGGNRGIVIKTLLCGGIVCLLFVFWLVTNPGFPRLYYGNTPAETANILQFDVEWGFRAISKGVSYGDAIIEPMRSVSGNFIKLNHRNTYCFANVLGQIKTPLSESAALELYNRNQDFSHTNGGGTWPFLCGAWALALQGKLHSAEKLTPILVDDNAHQSAREMAIQAAGETKDKSAVKAIESVLLQSGKRNYWLCSYCCIKQISHATFAPPACRQIICTN